MTNTAKKLPKLDIRQATNMPVEVLDFDRDNPRLQTGNEYEIGDDESIISVLASIAALDELILSICTNGYLNLEPLIVIEGPSKGRFTVLEGNRRLAALRLIRDPKLARRCRISLPSDIAPEVYQSTDEVLVYRVEQKSDAQAFIGFKHINGPHRWDAYAKAKFVADLYRKGRSKGLTIDEIARQTGDKNNVIRSYIASIFVLDQAHENDIYDIRDREAKGKFAFSHLYTALNNVNFRDFLGLKKGWDETPSDTPISRRKYSELKSVFTYIYGSKSDAKPRLVESQNPDLANLGRCLADPEASVLLASGETLENALAVIEGDKLFNETLVIASLKLQSALNLLARYDGNPSLLRTAKTIVERATMIHREMSEKTKSISS